MKKTILVCGVCLAFGSLGAQRAPAQLVPAPVPSSAFPGQVAHNTSAYASHPALSPDPAAVPQSDETKVVRIYRGTGYFDQALAEKLRPNLAKAFAPGNSAPAAALPVVAIAAGYVPPVPKPTKSGHL